MAGVIDVEYSGGFLADHPHRGEKNRPREMVKISPKTKSFGPELVGRLVIEATPDGHKTTQATGVFAPSSETNPKH